jgi:hypothetical protein
MTTTITATADALDAGYDLYRLRKLVAAVSAFIATADLSSAPAAELVKLQSELTVATMCVGGEVESRSVTEQGNDLPF